MSKGSSLSGFLTPSSTKVGAQFPAAFIGRPLHVTVVVGIRRDPPGPGVGGVVRVGAVEVACVGDRDRDGDGAE
eukprot:CAMPEP_0172609890 /NCGR_PEP_ID=MMETSP1068-20121228/29791_1 /TAXON_ID=35684 /ORGANISM="Pseudopedinella elastica, Strain CCMP716" /LENGTH=73 /DNA_ID=CAMNT_0013413497 /DNA_START=87 /DNA_END=305 /DNA_ORIENTATION=-